MTNNPSNSRLEKLLNALVPFAQEMLSKHGEFYPFGMYLNTQDEIVVTGQDLHEEHPASQKVIDSLVQIFRNGKENILAAGIAFDSKVETDDHQKVDAIAVRLEERGGHTILAHFPYKKVDDKYEFGEPLFSEGEALFCL